MLTNTTGTFSNALLRTSLQHETLSPDLIAANKSFPVRDLVLIYRVRNVGDNATNESSTGTFDLKMLLILHN